MSYGLHTTHALSRPAMKLDHNDLFRSIELALERDGRRLSVNRETEVYYDLGLTGAELYHFVEFLDKDGNVDFAKLNLAKYAPGEASGLFRDLLKQLGFRPYPSLTLGMLIDAVERGYWSE